MPTTMFILQITMPKNIWKTLILKILYKQTSLILTMKTLKMLVEVENSKIYVYSYDAKFANDGLCASDTINL
jgi:hypothetical protein